MQGFDASIIVAGALGGVDSPGEDGVMRQVAGCLSPAFDGEKAAEPSGEQIHGFFALECQFVQALFGHGGAQVEQFFSGGGLSFSVREQRVGGFFGVGAVRQGLHVRGKAGGGISNQQPVAEFCAIEPGFNAASPASGRVGGKVRVGSGETFVELCGRSDFSVGGVFIVADDQMAGRRAVAADCDGDEQGEAL